MNAESDLNHHANARLFESDLVNQSDTWSDRKRRGCNSTEDSGFSSFCVSVDC